MTQESEISALLQQFPNASPAEILARLDLEVQREVFRHMTKQEMVEFPYAWRKWWARPSQLAPPGEWSNWLVMAGRFFGKTRCGAEWIRERVDAGKARYIAIVGATGDDANYVMVNGPAGIIPTSPPKKAPEFIKGQLVWPNGATATLFSANEPARLRGPQHDTAWADELGVWRYPEAFSNLELGMRLGTDPRVLITTTPRPTALMKDIIARPDTVVTRGTSYDNRANVAAQIFRRILRYEGTRLGLQELEGRLLEDIPGALWTHDLIEGTRRKQEEHEQAVGDPEREQPDLSDLALPGDLRGGEHGLADQVEHRVQGVGDEAAEPGVDPVAHAAGDVPPGRLALLADVHLPARRAARMTLVGRQRRPDLNPRPRRRLCWRLGRGGNVRGRRRRSGPVGKRSRGDNEQHSRGKRRDEECAPFHPPTIRCTIETSTGASSASA